MKLKAVIYQCMLCQERQIFLERFYFPLNRRKHTCIDGAKGLFNAIGYIKETKNDRRKME